MSDSLKHIERYAVKCGKTTNNMIVIREWHLNNIHFNFFNK